MRGKVLLAVLLSYAGFVLVGLTSGSEGVLLLAQIKDYGVDRAVIGITFFVSSAGFFLASLNTGPLLHRFGFRATMVAGSGAFVLAALYLATRPTFWVFVAVQLVVGYAVGLFESVLNAYLAELPDATVLINRLHAFFGVGALGGPALAAWILTFGSWRTVWLVLALVCVPLGAGFAVLYPRARVAESTGPAPDRDNAPAASKGGLLGAALRERSVLLGSAMLLVYVGVELSVGSWGFSYLVQGRELTQSLAGWLVSGYWLGLTLGRFLISPIATRLGWSAIGMMYGCLTGVLACATLVWLVPGTALAGRRAWAARLLPRADLPDHDGAGPADGRGQAAVDRDRRDERRLHRGCLGAALAGGRHRPGRRGLDAAAVRHGARRPPVRGLAPARDLDPASQRGRGLASSGPWSSSSRSSAGRAAFPRARCRSCRSPRHRWPTARKCRTGCRESGA